ncbi:hypothetical protein CHS0354_039964 [Potamilus streckersoni]|uniref:Uncharacterized protein n=1 Tax=Potamilus streckersoni TaxID=2493646 RepID=A0AAE0W4X3_9BIVA|nr:hypothetical protein CHS0354_039964 [Potamilus streckersoni]
MESSIPLGSMERKKIQNAKEALLLFLKSIPVDSYFNVIGFGSGFESLFPTSKLPGCFLLQSDLANQSKLDTLLP